MKGVVEKEYQKQGRKNEKGAMRQPHLRQYCRWRWRHPNSETRENAKRYRSNAKTTVNNNVV